MALCLFAPGCVLDLALPRGVAVLCSEANTRCPGSLVCVTAIGRCVAPGDTCVSRTDSGFAPAADGLGCRGDGFATGVCVAGTCSETRCGDGRVDLASGEACDSGANNRDTWAVSPACRTDCSGPAPSCGDGQVAAEEACDDGFSDVCGGCNDTCSGPGVPAVCGDGVVCAEVEQCDDGRESASCNSNCSLARCGDGVLNRTRDEVCDDAERNTDGWALARHCNAGCSGLGRFCGDGTRDPEELCDEQGQTATCETTCQAPRCGDGVLNTLVGEACDTGGDSATCTAQCQPKKWFSAGYGHTCIIRDQKAYCFGDNAYGQCGADNPPAVGEPLETMGANLAPLPLDAPVDMVVAGLRFTCVRTLAGEVACFGSDGDAATGSGTPFVDTGGPVVDLAAGERFVCALRSSGDVVCWGRNVIDAGVCLLGRGDEEPFVGDDPNEMGAALIPVQLGNVAAVRSIYAGNSHACALLTDGKMKCWGNGARGRLGTNATTSRGCAIGALGDNLPHVDLPANIASVSLGGAHTCVLTVDQRVLCLGFNGSGQLGQGLAVNLDRGDGPLELGVFIPATNLGGVPVERLGIGAGNHGCAILRGGGVKCWGSNGAGQLGLGDRQQRGASPDEMGEALPALDLGRGLVAIDVDSKSSRTCVTFAGPRMKCFGSHVTNTSNSLLGRPYAFEVGDGPREMGDDLAFVPLVGECGNGIVETGEACDDGFTDACGSCNATCSAPGSASVCGDRNFCPETELCEEQGDGTCSDQCKPCPNRSCFARCGDGAVCGDGLVCEGSEVCEPGSADGVSCASDCQSVSTQLVAGYNGSCHLAADGSVRCFGTHDFELLGVTANQPIGDDPAEMAQLRAVDLGRYRRAVLIARAPLAQFTCVLLSAGTVKCWGDNEFGQLGTGDFASRGNAPIGMGDALPEVRLGVDFSVRTLRLGRRHACAVSHTGLVKCWGNNEGGLLGQGYASYSIGGRQGELGDTLPPIRLGDGFHAIDVAPGGEHTCALSEDGRVRCWGRGGEGQLGSGSAASVGDSPLHFVNPSPTPPMLIDVDLGTTDGTTRRRAIALHAAGDRTCALLEPKTPADSNLKCWGRYDARLGSGDPLGRDNLGDEPSELGDAMPAVDFGNGRRAVDLCLGNIQTCALLDDGNVRCWGLGAQLGVLGVPGSHVAIGDDNGEVAAFPNVQLGSGLTVQSLSCGAAHTCARFTDGRFKCWGNNLFGALGIESATCNQYSVPECPLGDDNPFLDLP